MPKSVLRIFGELTGKWVYAWVDNQCIIFPHSKNHPALVWSILAKVMA
jgi:hypothetical protein